MNQNENEKNFPVRIVTKDIPHLPPKDENNNLSIALKNAKYSRLVWTTHSNFHNHKFWEICLMLKGSGINHFPDRAEPMLPGSIWILRPHDVHYIEPLSSPRTDNTSGYAHRDIYVTDEKMKRLLNALDENLYPALFNAQKPLSATLSISYAKEFESTLNYYCMNDENFEFMHSVIVSHLIACTLEISRNEKRNAPDWINTLTNNFNREEFMIKSMDDIISSTGYSQSHVCRGFKKYMGVTLIEYIYKTKCLYSLSLLQDTKVSVADIAYRLNFSDESRYINIFKRIYKTTPGQWRKNFFAQKTKEDNL